MTIRTDHLSFIFFLFVMTRCSERGNDHEGNNDQLNRLAEAGSPYLREHADNPVDWYEWGTEALTKAEKENKPLLISIGYASCHWCHVMERESFMDTAVARFMNENFVSIKIDREERPDIDQIYLNAAQLTSGSAGWPLNAFALPDGRPYYAATYFPKDQWLSVLQQMNTSYRNEHDQVVKQAKAVTEGIRTFEVITLPAENGFTADKKTYQDIFFNWQSSVDVKTGGLKGAPKFPMPGNWEFLLQYHYLTGNAKALEFVVATLDQMAMGGIYDQIGGGFARYSVDENWKVPHFEKMLYDNGQLVSLYAHAYQRTRKPLYAEVVHGTLAFIEREMTAPGGGFYSSINADSEDEEGKFYVWTKEEITKALDPKHATILMDYFQVGDNGNWENGKSILYRKMTLEEFAEVNGMTDEVMRTLIDEGERSLLRERNKRIRPSTDDKILTSWNALMLKGYVDAYVATGEPRYIRVALLNARFLEKNMIRQDGHLWRSYKDGKAGIDAFLDDYALLARAYIQLYQATFEIHWLELSKSLVDFVITHFHDPTGGLFYYTADNSENLIARKMELTDHVIPSSNSVLAYVLYCLGEFYYDDTYNRMSRSMLSLVSKEVLGAGPYYSNWASLMGMISYQPQEVAIMGDEALEKGLEIQKRYLPVALFMGGNQENLPLLQNKNVEARTIIYVCRNKICKLPVADVDKALEQLK